LGRAASEEALQSKVDADPLLWEQYVPAWGNIREALDPTQKPGG
jgi:hypothetical protein